MAAVDALAGDAGALACPAATPCGKASRTSSGTHAFHDSAGLRVIANLPFHVFRRSTMNTAPRSTC